MNDDPERRARAVGRNIHRLRAAAGLSLADLAVAGEVSKTTLHGIEQGAGNPTLSTLWALATALGVPLGVLLEPDETPVTVVRAGDGPRADGEAVHARLLHRIAVHGTVEVYAIEVDPVEQVSRAHLPGVEECLVVTRGALRTGPADAPAELAEGDSVRFGAARPHLYRGLGGRSAGLLLMVHPERRLDRGPGRGPGEGERLRRSVHPVCRAGGVGRFR